MWRKKEAQMLSFNRAVILTVAVVMCIVGLMVVYNHREELPQESVLSKMMVHQDAPYGKAVMLPPSQELIVELKKFQSEMSYMGDLAQRKELAGVVLARVDGIDTTQFSPELRKYLDEVRLAAK